MSTPRLEKMIHLALVEWVKADPTLRGEVLEYLGISTEESITFAPAAERRGQPLLPENSPAVLGE